MEEKILWSGSFFILLLVAMALFPYSPPPFFSVINTTDGVIAEGNDMGAAFPLAFGGRVITVTPCTCSAGFQLVIGPPRPAQVLYQPGISVLFSFYNFLPANYALGTYSPGGLCLTGVPPFCATLPTLGTVIIMGTSGTPFSPSL